MDISLILIFILGVVLGGVTIWALLRKKPEKNSGADESMEVKTIIEKQAEEQQKNRQKVLDFLEQKSFDSAQDGQDASITNDEVQNLLGVSDASAERYLDGLEKEGVLRQVGKTGVKTFYQKT